jgi:hypothetical protein
VAFHLYQMYNEQLRLQHAPAVDEDDDHDPVARTEKEMRAEINRVGTTLMKMMEVGVR